MSSGLLVMAYGSPASPEDIESYYTHIRRGRPPTDAQLADLTARYEAIGGTSALARRTAEQLAAVEAALAEQRDAWVVTLGTKHSNPSIADGVGTLRAAGVDRIVGLVLAPHFSGASVAEYHRQAQDALVEAHDVTYQRIDSWYSLDEWVEFQAEQIPRALEDLPARTKVLFTAHSLPERVLVDDPYPEQLHESATSIAARAGLDRGTGWGLGWQSAGATPEPWRGPDLLETIEDLARNGAWEGILVVPQGFTSAHLEVLYDIDIEAAAAARQRGLTLARTQAVNDDPTVMAALASLVQSVAADASTGPNRAAGSDDPDDPDD